MKLKKILGSKLPEKIPIDFEGEYCSMCKHFCLFDSTDVKTYNKLLREIGEIDVGYKELLDKIIEIRLEKR